MSDVTYALLMCSGIFIAVHVIILSILGKSIKHNYLKG